MRGGIDEAGRGPVVGPLVVAGVVADADWLLDLGVRDSKRLTAARRERIARLLEAEPGVRTALRVVEAHVIDAERETRTMNDVGLARFREVGAELACTRLVVDACDVDAARFGRRVVEGLAGVEVVSEHRAEDRHPEVAAASILAKVHRDRLVASLARRLERRLEMPLGSGYPSDPKTVAFLEAWNERFGGLPEGARRSWETARRLTAPRQSVLPA